MQNKISTVIMGGTFNPVHIGHMHIADEVQKIFNPERILIVPSNISAHKKDRSVASAGHRLEMLKIAVKDSEFEIETCEIEREGVSYSIDTIRYIKEKYRLESAPGLLIGDDLAEGFNTWKNAAAVAEEAKLIVACRDFDELSFGFRHYRVNNLMLNISSSEIRHRLKGGKACRYLMPSGVYDYIIDNGLYGE